GDLGGLPRPNRVVSAAKKIGVLTPIFFILCPHAPAPRHRRGDTVHPDRRVRAGGGARLSRRQRDAHGAGLLSDGARLAADRSGRPGGAAGGAAARLAAGSLGLETARLDQRFDPALRLSDAAARAG